MDLHENGAMWQCSASRRIELGDLYPIDNFALSKIRRRCDLFSFLALPKALVFSRIFVAAGGVDLSYHVYANKDAFYNKFYLPHLERFFWSFICGRNPKRQVNIVGRRNGPVVRQSGK